MHNFIKYNSNCGNNYICQTCRLIIYKDDYGYNYISAFNSKLINLNIFAVKPSEITCNEFILMNVLE
jgi:ferredoxin